MRSLHENRAVRRQARSGFTLVEVVMAMFILLIGMTSILEELPGIGPGKRRSLLRHFGSLKAVRAASEAALADAPGVSARDAATVRRFFDALVAGAGDGD